VLPLWAFVACSRVELTFTVLSFASQLLARCVLCSGNKLLIVIFFKVVFKNVESGQPNNNNNNNKSETLQLITAACEQLAPTEYVKRHGLAKVIHQKLAEAAE